MKELESKALSDKAVEFWELVRHTAKVEDLGPAQQAHFRRVEATGVGVCAKCRWKSGCMNCDVEKAWNYCLKWELGLRCIDLTQFQEGNQAPKLSGGGGLSRVVEEKHYYIIVVAVVVGDVVVLWWCVTLCCMVKYTQPAQ